MVTALGEPPLSVWSENWCWDFGSRRTVLRIGVCSPCCRRGIILKTFLTEGEYFSELKNIENKILTPSELGDRAPRVNFSKFGWIWIAFEARNNRNTEIREIESQNHHFAYKL